MKHPAKHAAARTKAPAKEARPKKAATKAVAPKRTAPKKVTPKKVTPKKVAPKKVAPKKVAPKKAAPTKAAPKTAAPKKAATKKVATKTAAPRKAAPKKAAPKKATPDRTSVLVKRELVARYEQLLAEMAESRRAETHGWDAYWEAVGAVLDERLYLLTPEGTAEAWCARHTGESYRTCLRNTRIARYCFPGDEAMYTTEKLEAALTWIDRKLGGLPPRGPLKVDLEELRFPVERDGQIVELGLRDATAGEILAALRGRPHGAAAKPSPLERAFERVLYRDKALRAARVRVHDGHVSLVSVPLSHWTEFLRALRQVDWRDALPG